MRNGGRMVVLLVTSRETGRWVLPKGWAEKGLKGFELAAKEAFEEAGVKGHLIARSLGSYTYAKQLNPGKAITCRVEVFPLEVTEVLVDWPESSQRQRRWFSFTEAALAVDETDLSQLITTAGRQGFS